MRQLRSTILGRMWSFAALTVALLGSPRAQEFYSFDDYCHQKLGGDWFGTISTSDGQPMCSRRIEDGLGLEHRPASSSSLCPTGALTLNVETIAYACSDATMALPELDLSVGSGSGDLNAYCTEQFGEAAFGARQLADDRPLCTIRTGGGLGLEHHIVDDGDLCPADQIASASEDGARFECGFGFRFELPPQLVPDIAPVIDTIDFGSDVDGSADWDGATPVEDDNGLVQVIDPDTRWPGWRDAMAPFEGEPVPLSSLARRYGFSGDRSNCKTNDPALRDLAGSNELSSVIVATACPGFTNGHVLSFATVCVITESNTDGRVNILDRLGPRPFCAWDHAEGGGVGVPPDSGCIAYAHTATGHKPMDVYYFARWNQEGLSVECFYLPRYGAPDRVDSGAGADEMMLP